MTSLAGNDNSVLDLHRDLHPCGTKIDFATSPIVIRNKFPNELF